MTPEQIKAIAKQAGGTTYAVFDPYQPEVGTWMLSPAELAEFVRLVREQAFGEAVQAAGPEDSYQDEWFKAKADSCRRIKELK